MQTDGMLLSIVIPMFNEEKTVGNVIEQLKAALMTIGFQHEPIVVDDYLRGGSLQFTFRQNFSLSGGMHAAFSNVSMFKERI